MSTKNSKILEFKFEGIFKDDFAGNKCFEEYKKFIKFLDNKDNIKFILSKEDINKIININENEWKILECNAELFNSDENNSKYKISIYLENKFNNKKVKVTKSLMRNRYKFKYKDVSYYCFIFESMKSYFNEIRKKHEFYISIIQNNQKRIFQPEMLFMIGFTDFEIRIDYKYYDIKLEKLKYEDIYKIPLIIKGANLNLKLGLYTNLLEDDYKNFIYYDTNKRKNFLNYLTNLFGMENNIGICGPFGTGKTITLLKFLIESNSDRMFYINLLTIKYTDYSELQRLFKYESIKLFGGNIFNENEKFCSEEEKNIYKKIIDEIEKFDEKKNIFLLLENIIKFLSEILYQQNTYIIIDQYNSKYDKENKSLNHLLDTNKNNNNIYIIVSSTMDNSDIKKHFLDSLDLRFLYSYEHSSSNLRLNYYYIGCFIRLNHLDNYTDLLKDETPEFIKYLNEFGNLPLFYYELKKKLKWNGKLEQYMEDEKDKIINEIELFYDKNYKSYSITKFIDILKILSIINKKEIYFIDELSKEILNLPLKFLEIKKEEININDLKVFAFASKNQNLLDKYKEIEEGKDNKILNN